MHTPVHGLGRGNKTKEVNQSHRVALRNVIDDVLRAGLRTREYLFTAPSHAKSTVADA